jgi:hypothetical protein
MDSPGGARRPCLKRKRGSLAGDQVPLLFPPAFPELPVAVPAADPVSRLIAGG